MPPPPALLLAGPTAVGKSEVALSLAPMLGGEIISVDSMQVYRGMDIGTAKPSPEERTRVPHHLIDILNLTESFDAAQFAQRAREAVAQIQVRGRVAILCGGTGLYFKAFLEGLGSSPPGEAAVRAELQARPLPELLSELEQRDPATFAVIDRANPRRVIRALEVIHLTGKPFSAQRAPWSKGENSPRCFYGLDRPPAEMHARIDARVDEMFQRGLVEETRSLLARGLEQNPAAMQAIGYRQVVEHLRGARSLADTIALIKIRTRQFAKRQRTWFRRQVQVQWFQATPNEKSEALAQRVAALWRKESAENPAPIQQL